MSKYVALLDILGFKDLITRNSHEDVANYFNNFRIYIQRSLAKDKTTVDRNGHPTFDVRGSQVNSTIISDTFIFWTNDDGINDFFELIECLQDLLSFFHSLPKLHLRGGIAFGDFLYDDTGLIYGDNTIIRHPLIVGMGLINAYGIQKSMNIAGCTVSSQAIEAARQNNPTVFAERWQDLIESKKLLQYNIPLKDDSASLEWALNWVREAEHPTEEEVRDGFTSFNRTVDHPDVVKKIDNTVDFYNYVKGTLYNTSLDSGE